MTEKARQWLNPDAEEILTQERRARRLEAREAKRLGELVVAVCGVGGLGEAFVSEAVLRGVRRLVLIDRDRVEAKNLRRAIWYRPCHVGQQKVEALTAEIVARAPEASVEGIADWTLSEPGSAALRGADVVVAAFDNNFSRFHLQAELMEPCVPLMDLGAQEELTAEGFAGGRGQIRFSLPGGPCLLCLGLSTAEMADPRNAQQARRAGYLQGTTFTPRRVRMPNAHLALEAVDLLARWACGQPVERFLYWVGAERRFRVVGFTAREGCPMCSEAGSPGSRATADLASLRQRFAAGS